MAELTWLNIARGDVAGGWPELRRAAGAGCRQIMSG